MARRCKACTHEHRITIDQLLKDGESTSTLSKRYSISEDSLTRHRSNHLVTVTQTSSTVEMLRALISEYDVLAAQCKLKADLHGWRVAMNQKLLGLTQLADMESKNPELRQTSGVEKISIELIDSIVNSVTMSYEPCPGCGQNTVPKVVAPIPRRPLLN